jgi:opacity protein-like surface antigen
MPHRVWSIAATATMLAATPALADENSGLYVGAGLGDFSTEIDDIGDVDIDFDEDSDATKIFAGWRFNRFLAVQLDYIDFGGSTAALDLLEIESDTKGLAPSVVGTLPLGPVEVFARAGVLFYDLEVTSNGTELIDESGQDLVYGAGLGLTLLERLALRLEYEIVDISELDDAEAVWITAAWRF